MAKESTWTLDSDHPRLGGVSDHSSDDELIDYEVNNDCLSEESISEAEGEENQVHELTREGKLFWCSCGECDYTTEVESFCCNESSLIKRHISEDSNCVTEQSLFNNIIINQDGLEFTRQLIGNSITCEERRKKYFSAELSDSKYRNLAYKAFFSFVATKAEQGGAGERFVIPSCVVEAIRKAFPSPTGIYSGFASYRGKEALYMH